MFTFQLQSVLIMAMANFTAPYYGDYTYPAWAMFLGWVFALSSLIPIPTIMILRMWQTEGPFTEVWARISPLGLKEIQMYLHVHLWFFDWTESEDTAPTSCWLGTCRWSQLHEIQGKSTWYFWRKWCCRGPQQSSSYLIVFSLMCILYAYCT